MEISSLYDLTQTLAGDYLKGFIYPWEVIGGIADFIVKTGKTLGDEFVQIKENIWVHRTAKIAPTAHIGAPAIICAGAEVRHCAFIRGSALVGEDCVVGNSTELKNVILFNGVQVPHYNYVGDSILGYRSHLGAGAITSNVKSDKTPVTVHAERDYQTGLKKLGAMLGDGAEVGCNSVLNPGTVIGKNTIVYPLTSVRGVIGANAIVKQDGKAVKRI